MELTIYKVATSGWLFREEGKALLCQIELETTFGKRIQTAFFHIIQGNEGRKGLLLTIHTNFKIIEPDADEVGKDPQGWLVGVLHYDGKPQEAFTCQWRDSESGSVLVVERIEEIRKVIKGLGTGFDLRIELRGPDDTVDQLYIPGDDEFYHLFQGFMAVLKSS